MWDDEPSPWDAGESSSQVAGDTAVTESTDAATDVKVDWTKLPKCDPPKYTLHWVRPLYLNYRYIYDYRQNYYNDVIDWMNKRNKGFYREVPRAQEWAERVIRTYDEKNKNKSYKRSSDMGILMGYKPKIRHYSYHTRAYYSLKYQKIL